MRKIERDENYKGATFRQKYFFFFRRNVIQDRFFRPIVVLDEVSILTKWV